MPKTTIAWELYRSFLGVLTEGSLSGAARALGITQPTVGRHIHALEEAFGTALFTRSQIGLMPTQAAVELRPYAQAMQSTAAALERVAVSHNALGTIKGIVRVSCSDVVGVEVLPPVLTELCAAHPQLRFELVLTDRLQDLLHREADIAVRMARPVQEQLLARRVGPIEVGLHARRDYLQRRGTPLELGELAGHTIIGYDQATDFLRKAQKTLKGLSREMFTLSSDSNLAQLALIRGCRHRHVPGSPGTARSRPRARVTEAGVLPARIMDHDARGLAAQPTTSGRLRCACPWDAVLRKALSLPISPLPCWRQLGLMWSST